MFSAIFSAVGGKLVESLLANVRGIFKDFFDKKISEEELRVKLNEAVLRTFSEIEVSHAETLAKTYDSFMKAMSKSPLMKVVWASVTISQLLVLLWHQVGIPFIVFMKWSQSYPSSGSTVEWAYALVAACVGLGPVVLRTGPGAGSLASTLKGLIKK